MTQYDTVSKVILYLSENSKNKLELKDIAKHVGLSPAHLQKIFISWCGISPKQFSRFLTLEYAKDLLKENNTLLTANKLGLSSGGRLHDLFVDIEAMTPGEYKNEGENLMINYSTHNSKFGYYVVASTDKGVCNVLFLNNNLKAIDELKKFWTKGKFINKEDSFHKPVIDFFENKTLNCETKNKIKLHLKGTNYQIKVWQALLSIPEGSLKTYGYISEKVGRKDSLGARAAGSAIGSNPVGYIIPCHRVIKATGEISGYAWGVSRKRAIIGFESVKNKTEL